VKRISESSLEQWRTRTDRKPLLVLGARQVGKTYALDRFGRSAFPKCHIINFEQNPQFGDVFKGSLEPGRILQELALVQGGIPSIRRIFWFLMRFRNAPVR